MKRTIDYYCTQVERAKDEFMRDPRTLNALLDNIDKMKAARSALRTIQEPKLFSDN